MDLLFNPVLGGLLSAFLFVLFAVLGDDWYIVVTCVVSITLFGTFICGYWEGDIDEKE